MTEMGWGTIEWQVMAERKQARDYLWKLLEERQAFMEVNYVLGFS